jgi:uncharacterized protein (DUF433 family)
MKRQEMNAMTWKDRITVEPNVCHGKACIRGTRVMVAVVLDNLAAGVPVDELLVSYPSITTDDVRASLDYAAELARERIMDLPGDAA